MYLSYYNLKLKPFQISTDPNFLWLGEKHKEALSTLKYGILDNKGFLLLTGDIGTGKTTLVNTLLRILGSDTIAATVQDPALDQLDFFNFVAHAFGMGKEFAGKGSFLVQFSRFLHDSYYKGKKVLLIIDEAQRIPQDLLEEIRLLSNIERNDAKLLNIFFVGQNEFNDILLLKENRAIRQRITVNYNIPTLTEKETFEYIQHRLKVARATGNMFHADAIHEIYAFSKGYPRLINIICDRALLTGFVEESKKISAKIIKECAEELKIQDRGHKEDDAIRETAKKGNGLSAVQREFSSRQNRIFKGERASGADNNSNRGFGAKEALLIVCFVLIFVGGGYYFAFVQEKTANTIKPAVESANQKKMVSPLPAKPESGQTLKSNFPLNQEVGNVINEVSVIDPLFPGELTKPSEAVISGHRDEKRADDTPPPVVHTIKKLTIHFERNSNLPAEESLEELDEFADQLLRTPDAEIIVRGYTDSLGREQYNVTLSEFRANIIKGYLVGRGIKAKRITTIALGSKDPVAPNSTPEGRLANRRIEVEVKR